MVLYTSPANRFLVVVRLLLYERSGCVLCVLIEAGSDRDMCLCVGARQCLLVSLLMILF